MHSEILGGKENITQLQVEKMMSCREQILLEAHFKQVVWETSVFSGAISTELPPAQSWMKAQLQAAECKPQSVCSYCTLQVLLNFVDEHRPFCFHPPFGDAMAVACLLAKMRSFHLYRLWTRRESAIVLAVCAVKDTAKNSDSAHVPKECIFT